MVYCLPVTLPLSLTLCVQGAAPIADRSLIPWLGCPKSIGRIPMAIDSVIRFFWLDCPLPAGFIALHVEITSLCVSSDIVKSQEWNENTQTHEYVSKRRSLEFA